MNFRPYLITSFCAMSAIALASCSPNAATSTGMVETSSPSATNEVANNVANDVANSATNNATPAAASTLVVAKPDAKNAPDERYKLSVTPPNYPPALGAALAKVAVPRPLKATKVPNIARVRLETSRGNIEVQLNGKAAPLHVKSFLYLSGRGFYNGTKFHRYEPGFVIQGGDPLTKNAATAEFAGTGGPGYEVPREYNSLKHDVMVLAAARSADPNSAGSQFYFTLVNVPFLDKEQAQDGVGYTVYGKVLNGKDVVMKLRADDVLKKVVILSPQ